MVKDIDPGVGDSTPELLVNVNGTLFFGADDGTHGDELWKSDGTAAGTVMVKDIIAGVDGSNLQHLTNVNGTLFLADDDGVNGLELWKSDGTAAGTVMVKDIDPGARGSNPSSLTNVNGTLFFAASDGTNGVELWKSDGTAAGTVMVKDINPGAGNSKPQFLANVSGVLEFYAFDGTGEGLFRSDGTAAGTVEIATNVDISTPIGFASQQSAIEDLNGDRLSDVVWRNASGALTAWSMNGSTITSSGFATADGAAVNPDSSWSITATSDFNGDGNADMLWRNADGTLVDWTMNGNVITSSGALNLGGSTIKPDVSWSVAGVGDFNGDGRSDILWRDASGSFAEWDMNGSKILSAKSVIFDGAAVEVDASWSVAGIGDFNSDGQRDVLWRKTDGTLVEWNMNDNVITSSDVLNVAGGAVKPDASWSIAGIGDFNGDGSSDILWRNADGSLAEWLMNGPAVASSGSITFDGAPVTPDANWHVVEIGDFNGDNQSDMLWRNDSGTLAEWLMNGTKIVSSVTPNLGGAAISPDSTWSTQAKPTNFG